MLRSFGSSVFTTRPPIEIVPLGEALEPGDHAKCGRLAAARGSDNDDELPIRDLEVDAVHDLRHRRIA